MDYVSEGQGDTLRGAQMRTMVKGQPGLLVVDPEAIVKKGAFPQTHLKAVGPQRWVTAAALPMPGSFRSARLCEMGVSAASALTKGGNLPSMHCQ